MRLWIVVIAFGVAMSASKASAQRYWAQNQIPYCQSYSDIAACQDASVRLLVDKHGVATAEHLAQEGYQGLRLFRYDTFGTLWPTVSFMTRSVTEHRKEGSLEAHMVHADGQLTTLSVPAWESGWQELEGLVAKVKARQPPAEPDPPEPGPNGTIPIPPNCLHPPTIVVEVIQDGIVERWWPSGCGDSDPVATAAVFEVWEIAGAAFPHCGYVPLARFGRSLGRVRACLMVQGDDPKSALEVMDVLRPNIGGDTRVAYEDARLADDVTLTSPSGEVFEGRPAVVAALQANALGHRWLQILRARGADRVVTVDGQLNALDRRNPEPVRFSQTWQKSSVGDWVITAWVVEPGEPTATLAE